MASKGTAMGMVSPPLSVMSTTSAPSTVSQSKHWISVPSTSPTVRSASVSPGHLRRPRPRRPRTAPA